jgi:hypothetical protein
MALSLRKPISRGFASNVAYTPSSTSRFLQAFTGPRRRQFLAARDGRIEIRKGRPADGLFLLTAAMAGKQQICDASHRQLATL